MITSGSTPGNHGALYYVSMLASVGCVADTREVAAWFGDDIAFRRDTYQVDLAGLPMLGFMLRHVGVGSPALHRMRLAANMVVTGGKAIERGLMWEAWRSRFARTMSYRMVVGASASRIAYCMSRSGTPLMRPACRTSSADSAEWSGWRRPGPQIGSGISAGLLLLCRTRSASACSGCAQMSRGAAARLSARRRSR